MRWKEPRSLVEARTIDRPHLWSAARVAVIGTALTALLVAALSRAGTEPRISEAALMCLGATFAGALIPLYLAIIPKIRATFTFTDKRFSVHVWASSFATPTDELQFDGRRQLHGHAHAALYRESRARTLLIALPEDDAQQEHVLQRLQELPHRVPGVEDFEDGARGIGTAGVLALSALATTYVVAAVGMLDHKNEVLAALGGWGLVGPGTWLTLIFRERFPGSLLTRLQTGISFNLLALFVAFSVLSVGVIAVMAFGLTR